MAMKAKNRKAKAKILEAVEWAGGLSHLAAEMRVSDQTIREWLKLGRVPPTPARLLSMLMGDGYLEKVFRA